MVVIEFNPVGLTSQSIQNSSPQLGLSAQEFPDDQHMSGGFTIQGQYCRVDSQDEEHTEEHHSKVIEQFISFKEKEGNSTIMQMVDTAVLPRSP